MATDNAVTLRAQWLGQILRQMRERKGLTLKEVAEYLQRNLATVGRCEQGIYPIRGKDAEAMLDLYGVSDERQREVVLQLAGEVWQTGWWDQYAKDNVWGSTIDYVWLENRSHELRIFSMTTIPGILQTEAYARALIEVSDRRASRLEIERWVELRMTRQQVLSREDSVRLSVVLDEAVVRRKVGGAEIMASQVRHLLAMAQRDNVDIRILSFDVGAHASPNGPFTVLKMSDPFPEVAHIESSAGSLYLEGSDIDRFVSTYDWLYEHSLSSDESAALLAALEKDLR